MPNTNNAAGTAVGEIPALIAQLYAIVDRLEAIFPGRPFTIDGHLLGSIGEVLAAYHYGLDLSRPSTQGSDAESVTIGKVEVKTTQRSSVAFRSEPPHLLVFKLGRDGIAETVYNGPGSMVWPHVGPRQKNGQCGISLRTLALIQQRVPTDAMLPRVTP